MSRSFFLISEEINQARSYCPGLGAVEVEKLLSVHEWLKCLTVHIKLKNPASRKNYISEVLGIFSSRVLEESAV